jgi:lipopolysaccharide transport system permease protein
MTALPHVQAQEHVPAVRPFRIRAGKRGLLVELREVWDYRELLGFLVWRDIKVRYVQTILGPLWALIVPFLTMILLTVIFGHVAGLKGEYKVPYPIFVFSGNLIWIYFSGCLAGSARSVISNINLVTKVYVPRLMIPLESTVVPVIDFALAFLVLLGLFAYYHRAPHWHTVLIPFFLGLALLSAFGVGLWLSALTVRFRDIPYVVPLLTQLWFYVSPVIYGSTFIPPRYHWLIAVNPMTGPIDGFRWAVLGRGVPHYGLFATSLVAGIVLTASGVWYFLRTERSFADLI